MGLGKICVKLKKLTEVRTMVDIEKLLDNSIVKVRFLKKDLHKVLDALNQIDYKLSEEGKNENGKEEK